MNFSLRRAPFAATIGTACVLAAPTFAGQMAVEAHHLCRRLPGGRYH